MSENREIPRGWEIVRLGDVCSFEYGKALKAANRKKGGKFPVLGSNGCVGFHDTYLVNGPGVVIGRKGAAGEISFVGKDFWPIDTTYFLKLNKDLSLLYFYFLLRSLRLNQFEKSTAIPGLNRNDAYDQTIPLPPLPEQHRIVAKIEELFSSLDKGIESLKTAQQQLKVYRQAVLKWAFEGKLTNRNVVEGELPEGWKKVKLGEVVKTIDGDRGPNYPKKDEFLQRGHCLFLSTKNVREDSFVFEDNIFISKGKDEILRGGKLQLSDVVITTRGTLGNVALYDEKIPYKHIRINSGMLILRKTNESLNNYYLMKFITSPIFISQLKEKQTGTAQQQIPANVLREIEIPLTPIPEQHAIVSEIESRLSVCDKIEESIEYSLKQSEALRQSILKKAFEGKLVPQNPSDEPASVLLERIKAEREKQAAEQRNVNSTRKTKNKTSSVGAKYR